MMKPEERKYIEDLAKDYHEKRVAADIFGKTPEVDAAAQRVANGVQSELMQLDALEAKEKLMFALRLVKLDFSDVAQKLQPAQENKPAQILDVQELNRAERRARSARRKK